MSKIMALDLGDRWIGVALSDVTLFFAKPYQTINIDNINEFLSKIIKEENIKEIVLGYPKTLKGTESDQTRKIVDYKDQLQKDFKDIKFILWDERLSSKRAQTLKPLNNKNNKNYKEDKLKLHSIAAAFILESYLLFLNSKI